MLQNYTPALSKIVINNRDSHYRESTAIQILRQKNECEREVLVRVQKTFHMHSTVPTLETPASGATSGFLCPMSGISLPFSFTFEGQLKARSGISEVKLTIMYSRHQGRPPHPNLGAQAQFYCFKQRGRKIVKSVLDCVS